MGSAAAIGSQSVQDRGFSSGRDSSSHLLLCDLTTLTSLSGL